MTAATSFGVPMVMAALLAGPAAALSPVPLQPGNQLVPVASSDAHRPDAHGNYGGLKSRSPSPPIGTRNRVPEARKQPYPYRYYQEGKRGNYGCHWMGRRAIETNNKNWWARYRACTRSRAD